MPEKPITWDTTTGVKAVARVAEDSGIEEAELVRSRLEGYDSAGLTWRRVKVDGTGQLMTTGGGGGGGGPATIADGADVAEGATTDAAVVTDVSGTVSGKLRGLVKWAFERMPASLGQKTMAASLPVVLASDQTAIPVTGAGGGTQYAEDTVSAAGDQVTMAGVVRKDAAATLVDTDGDRTQLQVDASGQLRVVTPPGGAGLTNTELRASPVPVSGTVTADTELEVAAALADASGNPTTPRVGAGTMVWNGTGWDRARGDIANGIDVDVTRVQGSVTVVGP